VGAERSLAAVYEQIRAAADADDIEHFAAVWHWSNLHLRWTMASINTVEL